VRVEGRDLSSRLVEATTRESFSNLSAAEIVSLLASRHGLTPNVFPTPDLVGRFFGNGHDQIMLGGYSRLLTEWDLVVYLAQYFGYDAYVEGTTLYFQPKGFTKRAMRLALGDLSRLRVDRDLQISSSAAALVGSWNAQLGLVLTDAGAGSAGQAASGSLGSSGPLQAFMIEPNLRSDQLAWLKPRRVHSGVQVRCRRS
jgi:hypothetical protein